MMTFNDFTITILTLKAEFNFSITSWLRSKQRNIKVGGNVESFHLCGLGIDCVVDNSADKGPFIKRARRLGLDAVDEGDHIHLEPAG